MATFIKAQFSSVIATIADFAITAFLKECLHTWYVAATCMGSIGGGLLNFKLSRRWVFDAQHLKVSTQLYKYIVVWIGNLLLNTWGVFMVTHFFHVSYIISKLLVSMVVGYGYNYTLQKKFVFK
jgi:putative flippase GtrA